MKTLDQWLEDSDEEDAEEDVQRDSSVSDGTGQNAASDAGRSSASRVASGPRTSGAPSLTGSHVSVHTPTTLRPADHPAGGAYARQEETREKMRRLLGAEAVVKATTPTSSTSAGGAGSGGGGSGSPTWPISAPPDRTHFPFGATPTTTQHTAQGLWTPPTLGGGGATVTPTDPTAPNALRPSSSSSQALARVDTATDSSQLPEVEQTMKGFNLGGSAGAVPSAPVYAAVEVMVVDRGTQTVTSQGTQTEPVPISVGPFYTGPYVSAMPMAPPSGYGAFSSPMAPAAPAYGFGVDGRPYRQYLYDYEKREAEEASKLREELGMIQNSIDMLIARYNLPPPPM